jgi:hypothetical protein
MLTIRVICHQHVGYPEARPRNRGGFFISQFERREPYAPPPEGACFYMRWRYCRRCRSKPNKTPDGTAFLTNRMMRDRTISPEHRTIRSASGRGVIHSSRGPG